MALCCGDAQLADDVAQEAYIKAYLHIGRISKTEKFKAWIFRTAYNTFLNHKRSERVTAGYDEAGDPVSPSGPEEVFAYQDLHNALDRLSVKERTAVLLFYLEGYSVREVAEILDVSGDSVKQYLSRGRFHLRGYLSKSDYGR